MVYIPAEFVCQMLMEISKHIPNETGGVMAGRVVNKSKWIITHITLSGPNAVHSKFSFSPDYDYDEKQIAKIYEETNCGSVYLGDWHSHPNAKSYMSNKDKNVLRGIYISKEARMRYPLMLIIGTSPFELRCWTYIKSKIFEKDFVKLPVTLLKNIDFNLG